MVFQCRASLTQQYLVSIYTALGLLSPEWRDSKGDNSSVEKRNMYKQTAVEYKSPIVQRRYIPLMIYRVLYLHT